MTRTASGARSAPGTWITEPTSMRRCSAVSVVTAASTARVVAVTVPVARGSRPERGRAWPARSFWAASTTRGGTLSGRARPASGTASGVAVRTP